MRLTLPFIRRVAALASFAVLALLLALAQVALQAQEEGMRRGGPPSRYAPAWESLRRHPLPQWFDDAKVGIFIHWGLYSVPAWAPPSGELGKVDRTKWFLQNPYAEWYLNTVSIPDSPTHRHHKSKYGDNFTYWDFIPEFNRGVQNWSPQSWARLFKEAGARYAVLTTKHHDGFTLWPSKVNNPHRSGGQHGVQRDLVGELTTAVRAEGLHMGLYYSGGLDWTFGGLPIVQFGDLMKAVPQSEEYARYADAHWRELIQRYNPDVLWNDINYPRKGDLLNIFADYYNKRPDGLINNRFGVEWADFTTPEYARYDRITEKKWESCRGLGFSFGYNTAEGPEHVLSADALVDLLVDIVSKNGNLLINIGPRPDGSISDLQVDRLKAMGRWLAVNGEAIYSTRPFIRPSTKASGANVRFTRKGDAVYAILLDKPASQSVTIESLFAPEDLKIELLGASSGPLQWKQSGKDLTVTLPAQLPGEYAWVLRMTPAPWQLVRE